MKTKFYDRKCGKDNNIFCSSRGNGVQLMRGRGSCVAKNSERVETLRCRDSIREVKVMQSSLDSGIQQG